MLCADREEVEQGGPVVERGTRGKGGEEVRS